VIYTGFSGLAAIYEKIPIGLIVYDRACPGIIISRVSNGITIKIKVVTEKKPYLPLIPLQIYHLDLFDIYVQVHINQVMAAQFQTQGLVFQKNVGYKGVILIPQVLFPFRTHPGTASIHPHAKTKSGPVCMVLLSYKREIDIPDLIIRVKIQKKIAVAYGNIFGHGFPTWLLKNDFEVLKVEYLKNS
jgi:hypothetical protein